MTRQLTVENQEGADSDHRRFTAVLIRVGAMHRLTVERPAGGNIGSPTVRDVLWDFLRY